ncbi:hypothetical protein M752DRAFT_272179 [Aspergillus phoenicis ATCC 13157]|uniref:Secreted protein n=1 Tax=Aspergillus phoenicis ATCC 13157 TaxID=1353007 RepID=A0A370Q0L6_ASPPH|nr:hypothetical protein M752DRAFT_272179 [Aspergillus phoenicis ATCC 13157]
MGELPALLACLPLPPMLALLCIFSGLGKSCHGGPDRPPTHSGNQAAVQPIFFFRKIIYRFGTDVGRNSEVEGGLDTERLLGIRRCS